MATPGEVSVEGLISRLASPLGASDTSATLDADYDSFPTSSFQILVGGEGGEVMLVGSRSAAALSSLTRAQEGTAAVAHPEGVSVEVVVGGEKISQGGGGGGSQPVAPFEVKDGSGNTVFQVDVDGTLHMKTGSTIQADLS